MCSFSNVSSFFDASTSQSFRHQTSCTLQSSSLQILLPTSPHRYCFSVIVLQILVLVYAASPAAQITTTHRPMNSCKSCTMTAPSVQTPSPDQFNYQFYLQSPKLLFEACNITDHTISPRKLGNASTSTNPNFASALTRSSLSFIRSSGRSSFPQQGSYVRCRIS
jgi:hypothetical protein